MDRQMILAQGVCHYDSTIAGLEALNTAARAAEEGNRAPVMLVPLRTINRLRIELRLLLDRWDRDYPGAVEAVHVLDRRDIGLRAGLVRAWLTIHVDELDTEHSTERG